jgi:3-methylfumaryl-CoA hydratase
VNLGEWQPTIEESEDLVTAGQAAALHGLLDSPGDPPVAGDALPPLWHWLAFLPRVPQRDLGSDGHPRRGGFLPPIELPRRMFAGGRYRFVGPLPVGAPMQRSSEVVSVEEKSGKSGALVFVKVRHSVSSDGAVAVVEEQDLVYRGDGGGSGAPRPPAGGSDEAAETWEWTWELPIEPTLLFRFSALTYNSHRIHYDRPYATSVEGYPGLVVHGPLQAIGLAELCRRNQPGRAMSEYRFRAVSPAFDDGPVRFAGKLSGEGSQATLAAADHAGVRTMEASATFVELRGRGNTS